MLSNGRRLAYSLFLVVLILAASAQGTEKTSSAKLKWVNIADLYKLQVPSEFRVRERTDNKWQTYVFEDMKGSRFSVIVRPYSISGDELDTDCKVSIEFYRGDVNAPIHCSAFGPSFEPVESFETAEGLYAFAGWYVHDLSTDCTSMSPCPWPVTPERRYSVFYSFFVPDKEHHHTILEFSAPSAYQSPSPRVDGFEGVAKLLHDAIIPSLTPLRVHTGDKSPYHS